MIMSYDLWAYRAYVTYPNTQFKQYKYVTNKINSRKLIYNMIKAIEFFLYDNN